ncbi:MAG: hypothetical protein FJW30_22420 [Acidobacteria bacterium]|nr:hypothetical protein [Acidobacteriota bacterium]
MATGAQILANQINSEKSTGPKTAEGKSRSSRNRTSHGLAAQAFAIPAADRAAFDEFTQNLKADLRPEGPVQTVVFEALRDAAWRLLKIRALTCELAATLGADPFSVPEAAAELRQLARYRAGAEMQFYRALKLLREAQQMSIARETFLTTGEQSSVPPLVSNHSMRYRYVRGQRYNTADRRVLELVAAPADSPIRTQFRIGSPSSPPPSSI